MIQLFEDLEPAFSRLDLSCNLWRWIQKLGMTEGLCIMVASGLRSGPFDVWLEVTLSAHLHPLWYSQSCLRDQTLSYRLGWVLSGFAQLWTNLSVLGMYRWSGWAWMLSAFLIYNIFIWHWVCLECHPSQTGKHLWSCLNHCARVTLRKFPSSNSRGQETTFHPVSIWTQQWLDFAVCISQISSSPPSSLKKSAGPTRCHYNQ